MIEFARKTVDVIFSGMSQQEPNWEALCNLQLMFGMTLQIKMTDICRWIVLLVKRNSETKFGFLQSNWGNL